MNKDKKYAVLVFEYDCFDAEQKNRLQDFAQNLAEQCQVKQTDLFVNLQQQRTLKMLRLVNACDSEVVGFCPDCDAEIGENNIYGSTEL